MLSIAGQKLGYCMVQRYFAIVPGCFIVGLLIFWPEDASGEGLKQHNAYASDAILC